MFKSIKTSLVLSLFVTGAANAAGGAYLGADFAFSNETELKVDGISLKDNNDVGFNLVGGYAFEASEKFKIGLEAEYRTIGDVTYLDVLKGSGSAFYLNAKPMFFFTQNAYIAGLIGLGSMELELKNLSTNETASESDSSLQLGVEGGYVFNNGLGLNAGYRSANADIDGVDITVSGFYAGLRYNF
ncbi:outer membrane beta-barrel protein [Agarivorans sp. Alg241-V36]|uniref:outer membrane beta-barrel protein n=1 Tax=Agarivorans sp. Alg241-V36 TaxID=2305992 RepID=UPI0013D3D084|nr:outer membrane beta-barrel protein [Agarivorans sp. Alg241-V36]